MFIDEIQVFSRAGHGGKGAVAFHREAYRPKGGPSGGNGGRGGDVVLEADHDLNNLIQQFYQPQLLAENGRHGMGRGKDGRAGKDLLIKVPCGTLVWKLIPEADSSADEKLSSAIEADTEAEADMATPLSVEPAEEVGQAVVDPRTKERAVQWDPDDDLPSQKPNKPTHSRVLVCDLTQHGQRFVLCKGGRGGLGNRNFATSVRQAPRFAQPGEPGEEGQFQFELRLLADVGLVGYPNAGKSTLLTAISEARPRIAPYPFTTLTPQIGIVQYQDFFRLVVCDIPGIIEGAHQNVGLGHAFLRHIQRCAVLVILLDMAGTDGRTPWDDYRHIRNELEQYDPSMLERRHWVVANKMDELAAQENLLKFQEAFPDVQVLPISAGLGEGLDRFRTAIREAVEECRKKPVADAS